MFLWIFFDWAGPDSLILGSGALSTVHMLRNSGDNAEEGETDGGRREGEAYLTVALVVLLVVVAEANDGGQAVCSQCMAIPDSVSALSLFCDFFMFLLLPVSISCFSVSSSSLFFFLQWLKVEWLWWQWGGIAMAESRHGSCGNQWCCFPSSSYCCSSGRKMAAGGDDDGGATMFVAVVFLSFLLLFLFLLCFVWFLIFVSPCLFFF